MKYVSKWPYFEALKFLDDFVTAKKSTSNLEIIHKDTVQCFSYIIFDGHETEPLIL